MILFSPFVVFVTDTANISTTNPTPRPYSTLKYLTLCPRASLSMLNVGQQNCFIASSKRKHKHKQSPAKILFIHWNIQKLKVHSSVSSTFGHFIYVYVNILLHYILLLNLSEERKRREQLTGAKQMKETSL